MALEGGRIPFDYQGYLRRQYLDEIAPFEAIEPPEAVAEPIEINEEDLVSGSDSDSGTVQSLPISEYESEVSGNGVSGGFNIHQMAFLDIPDLIDLDDEDLEQIARDNTELQQMKRERDRLRALRDGKLPNKSGGGKSSGTLTPAYPFKTQLEKIGLGSSSYLKEARRRAKEHHYPYKLLGFASDGTHKLAIPDANGRMVAFGKVGYGDHIIYSYLEKHQKVPSGTADAKQRTFHKSHSRIKGDWASKPFSPNNLALRVLW